MDKNIILENQLKTLKKVTELKNVIKNAPEVICCIIFIKDSDAFNNLTSFFDSCIIKNNVAYISYLSKNVEIYLSKDFDKENIFDKNTEEQ